MGNLVQLMVARALQRAASEIQVEGERYPEQLMATIDLIADRADHYDTRLQKRFGGQTMLDDDEGDEFDV